MDEATLTRVIRLLETDPDFYVPVKRLWLTLQEEGLALDLDLESFHAGLAADDRFEFIEGVDYTEEFEDNPELIAEIEEEMEAQGFFGGPRVKLVSRKMTAEDVFAGLYRSLAQLNAALQEAWETRPEGDAEAEEILLDALALAEQLERDIREMIEEQEEQPAQEDEG